MKPFSMPIRDKCRLRNPTPQDEIPFSSHLSSRSSFEPRTSYLVDSCPLVVALRYVAMSPVALHFVHSWFFSAPLCLRGSHAFRSHFGVRPSYLARLRVPYRSSDRGVRAQKTRHYPILHPITRSALGGGGWHAFRHVAMSPRHQSLFTSSIRGSLSLETAFHAFSRYFFMGGRGQHAFPTSLCRQSPVALPFLRNAF